MGEIEKDGKVLVLRHIHVQYRLAGVDPDQRDTVERVLAFHADRCPVARSVAASIAITTGLDYA